MKSAFQISILLFSLFVTGCTATPIKLYEGSDMLDQDLSIIESSCDELCKASIEEELSLERYGFNVSPVSAVIVVSLNDIIGDNKHFNNTGSFNNSWDGSFFLKTLPGDQRLLLHIDYWRTPHLFTELINLKAEKNNTYFVGQVLNLKMLDEQFQWSPVIYNKTQGVLIYPPKGKSWINEKSVPYTPTYINYSN
jgi:hypothetical protein